MIPLHLIYVCVGFLFFVVTALFHWKSEHNFDPAKILSLAIASFISASGVTFGGFNAIYFVVTNEVYPGQSFEAIRGATMIGGLVISIWSIYAISWTLQRRFGSLQR